MCVACAGPVYKYDFSMPLPRIYDLVEATRSRLAHLPATVVSYGHLGQIPISPHLPCTLEMPSVVTCFNRPCLSSLILAVAS